MTGNICESIVAAFLYELYASCGLLDSEWAEAVQDKPIVNNGMVVATCEGLTELAE